MPNPFDQFDAPPKPPGVIYGPPKQIDPVEAERLRLQQEANARAQAEENRKQLEFQGEGGKPTEAQLKSANFLLRALGANEGFENTGLGGRNIFAQAFQDTSPNLANNLINSDARQVAIAAQEEFVAAILRYDSGAAVPPEERTQYIRQYFPQTGDSEDAIEYKRQARRRAIEGLKVGAGPLEAETIQRWEKLRATPPPPQASAPQDNGKPWTMADTVALWGEELYDENGAPLGPDGGAQYDRDGNYLGLIGSTTYEGVNDYPGKQPPNGVQSPAMQEFINQKPLRGEPGYGDILMQGATAGLSDEASGIGGVMSRALKGDFNVADNYRLYRDAERIRIEQARQLPGGQAVEFVGGFGAFGAGSAPTSIGSAVRSGAAGGAAFGYGYGEGTEGSLAGTAGGGLAGAALGYGGARLGESLTARAATRDASRKNATEVAQAAQAEGITAIRAMVDPTTQNRVTRTDASVFGGPTLQKGMREIEGQIEGRVAEIGGPGKPQDNIARGKSIKDSAERFIKSSGAKAKIKYDRAEKLAGGAKIEPKESLAQVDQMIAKLSETPETNKAEIKFLNKLRSDLSNDLSVGALRRMRTSMRQRINKGELTFGEDEARVLGIMDAAAIDIENGLAAQGKVNAARAFSDADKAYRARMDYIKDVIQKVIGNRNSNRSAEDIARTFNSMAKGKDAVGLRKFMASLDPEERADVAATFAAELGRMEQGGPFSVAKFLTQTNGMSEHALTTLFGREGAQSIQNLRRVAKEVVRVTGAMNSRTSKSGVANYRTWLFDLLLGAAAGGAHGSLGTAASVSAGAAGLSAGSQYLSARALMSPKITKWIATAPPSTSPGAINAHFDRLAEIARAEPALAGDIEQLRRAIFGAANDNMAVPAAAGESTQEQQ